MTQEFKRSPMTIEDLRRNLKRHVRVIVDIRPIEGLPGLLRATTVLRDLRIEIEFLQWQAFATNDPFDCVALRYGGSYENEDVLIAAVENFLELPLSQWSNYTVRPYFDQKAIDDYLHGLVVSGCDLPEMSNFRLLLGGPIPPRAEDLRH